MHRLKTGVVKEAAYSATSSFLMKVAASVGMIAVGRCLSLAGYEAGADEQTFAVGKNITGVMVVAGMLFTALASLAIIRFPVNRAFMERIKNESAATNTGDSQ
jgi:Na+/melibiose symporter-like transporter